MDLRYERREKSTQDMLCVCNTNVQKEISYDDDITFSCDISTSHTHRKASGFFSCELFLFNILSFTQVRIL